MTRIIAIGNQKGGVGKTTTTINLGTSLAREGQRVLLVDLDAQANLSMSLGHQQPDELSDTIASLMLKTIRDEPIEKGEGIMRHGEGAFFIPSNIELSGLETILVNTMNRERVLKTYLNSVKQDFDFILIDCQPSLGLMTINALAAADSVLIPAQPHFLSVKGLDLLAGTINQVRRSINRRLSVEGILLTMVDTRSNFTKEMLALVKSTYGRQTRVFEAEIPVSVRVPESGTVGASIHAHAANSKVAAAYAALAKEVMQNGKREPDKQNPAR